MFTGPNGSTEDSSSQAGVPRSSCLIQTPRFPVQARLLFALRERTRGGCVNAAGPAGSRFRKALACADAARARDRRPVNSDRFG